jgi:SagB-type dehydrogenase family enzyme
MIPITRKSTPATNMVRYWNDACLRVALAKSTSVRPAPQIVPWHAALEDVLKVGYGVQVQPRFLAGAWQQVRWRTTPSAGALYPFEVIASVIGKGSYLWDVEKGHLAPCAVPVLRRDDLARAGLITLPGQRVEALLIFVARPWLSMKKYFLRGYAYCHLDVGHTAANLALYIAALGHNPLLHLRFARAELAERLALDGLCREPLAVLSLAGAEPGSEPPDGAMGEVQGPPVHLEMPGNRELENWDSLQGILSFEFALEPAAPPNRAELLRRETEDAAGLLQLPHGQPPLAAPAEWHSAILRRRSAKGFREEPVTLEQIGELLGALRGLGLTADSFQPGAMQLGVRLVAMNVCSLTGVFSYAPAAHGLRQIDAQAGDPRPACMRQSLAGSAAAMFVIHAPVSRLFEQHGYSAFAELHFRAAELGQRLHLAATRLGALGVTCIGGFDGEECAALARLDAGEEVLYVVLAGISDDSVFKHDRLNVAFSHGHTSTLEDE